MSLSQLNAAVDEDFVSVLGGIYEHSDWVPRRLVHQRPFSSAENLRLAMRQVVEQASDSEKLALIRAHPDLAGKLVKAGLLTRESTREQAGLGLDRLEEEEYDQFQNKNALYQEKFGFPFIICARMTTKRGVLIAFETRLGNSRENEISEALIQIHEIARLRLEDALQE
ncbi:MAG: 2-oxo-4-hydroxy-4-carboxy-5-ureidoimidazoline decarboxylase [Gloeobacteraceae cyanobacterium ES-bin-144]|nr:2-oxo-4-hydroxy-4-carboxy-5-ureidoimidazoline decarboxylase [Verrucomicrobiales bacterium]